MSNPIISVNNLSKKYRIAHERGSYMTLRDRLAHPIQAFKQDRQPMEDFWALNDVSFEVEQGDVVGIIGSNGSGKSTLLKILSQITPPTKGHAVIRGRVASLLEVGTGFHPELTGRENIYLSGIILGMTRAEIQKHFDEIVAFSGVEKFLDTPVKRYSSGMMVRLGFAVAAHLEPEILIIDEVLAVGDAEFQKKCLGKMDDIACNNGRTILFVSHNMSAIKNLCTKGVFIKNGDLLYVGDINTSIEHYLVGDRSVSAENSTNTRLLPRKDDDYGKLIQIIDFKVINEGIVNPVNINSLKQIEFKIRMEAKCDTTTGVYFVIRDSLQNVLWFDSALMQDKYFQLSAGEIRDVTLRIDPCCLTSGNYFVNCGINMPYQAAFDFIESVYSFTVPVCRYRDSMFNITQKYAIYSTGHDWV